jgi:PAS domain S-box-containing protein
MTIRPSDRDLEPGQAVLEESVDFRAIFENTPFGLAVIGHGLNFIHINAAFRTLIGKSGEEIAGRPVTEFLSLEDAAQVSTDIDRIRRGESVETESDIFFTAGNAGTIGARVRISSLGGTDGLCLMSVVDRRPPDSSLSGRENQFRSLFRNSRDFLFISDPDGRILEVNDAATSLSGYSIDELKRLHMKDLYERPDDREVLLGTLMAQGYVDNFETRGRKKDGSAIDVLVNASILRNPAGGILGFQGSLRDISERKRAELDLKVSEERFRSLYENATIGIYRTTPDGRILLANPALVRMLGYSSFDELAERNLNDPGFEPEYVRREFRERIERDGTVVGLESVWKHKDGTSMFVRESALLIRGEDGRPLFYDGVAEDISDRVRTEDALKRTEARLTGFMNSAVESIYLLDADLHFVDINPRAEQLLNRKRKDVLGKNLADLLPSVRETPQFAKYMDVIRTGKPVEFEDFVSHPVFGGMHFIVKAFKVGDGLGLIAHEITGRVQAEQALQSSERRFRALIENSSDAIALIDPSGIVLYHSASYERVMGYCVDERTGRNTFDLIHPEDKPRVSELLAGILREGGRVALPPVRVRHASGTWRWIEGVANNLLREPAVAALVVNFRDITERKEAEKALAHSHDLMRYIIEHNRSAVAVHDKEMKYIYVSQRYLDDYKVKEQDVIGKNHYDVFPDLPQKWRDVHLRVLKGAVESAEDDPYVREDGSVDWTRWECRPWYEADGSIGGLIVYTEVVTERKRAEAALRESEERFRRMFQYSAAGMVLVGMDRCFLQINHAFCRMLGYSETELRARTFQDVTHADDRAPGDALTKQLISGDLESFQLEKRYSRKDGSTVWGLVSSTLIRDTNGRPLHFVTQIQDISERKRMENELMQSEALLQASQKTARMGHFIWDIGKDNVTVSRTLEEVLGIDARYPRSLEGWLRLVHPEDRPRFQESLTVPGLKEIESFDTGCRIRRAKDRKVLWVQIMGHVDMDAHGNPARIFGTIQDVTERKLAEERIQADLREKEILLKEIHHRVKNNLQVISSMLALQSKSIEDPEIQAVFQSCRDRVHSIGLVHEKLYRTKSLTSVDFGEYARTMLRDMMAHYDAGGRISARIRMRPVQLEIETAIPVGLILSELVTNALKHAFPANRKGMLQVDFRIYRQRFWRMAVSDDGIGLPRRKAGPGSEGFGMELIRILTEQLEGKLQVRRAKGTTFTITFPAAGAQPEKKKPKK